MLWIGLLVTVAVDTTSIPPPVELSSESSFTSDLLGEWGDKLFKSKPMVQARFEPDWVFEIRKAENEAPMWKQLLVYIPRDFMILFLCVMFFWSINVISTGPPDIGIEMRANKAFGIFVTGWEPVDEEERRKSGME